MARPEIAEGNPVYLADKPKRIPVWLGKEEQARFEIFGGNPQRMTETRRRYERLFGLLLSSGLRIGEIPALQVSVLVQSDYSTKF